jgi:Mrp family chromosome partitioning ATPase
VGVYSELINTIFEAGDSEGQLHNRVVAFTSALPEEDVSNVVQSFAKNLAAETKKRVIIVDARAFHDLDPADSKNVLRECAPTEIENVLILSAAERGGRVSTEAPGRIAGWHSIPQLRQAYLKTLCGNFDYVIIDCPALSASADVKALAPNIHGVVVVVEPKRKRRRQAHTSQDVIERSGGKFLGYILN